MMGRGVVVLGGDLQMVTDVAVDAERAGFDSVWTTEFYERTATISLAAMATVTTDIMLGSAIAWGVGRSPLVLSAEARDLDELSNGRLVLGLGTGTRTMLRDWHGEAADAPAVRVEELVPLLRRFWAMDDTGVHHDGRFYHVALTPTAEVRPPLRRDIPVYVAGVNRRMVRAAGTVADGLVGHPIFTRRYVEEVVRPALADGAERSERSPDDITLAGYVICAIDDDADRARNEARGQIAFYSLVRTYSAILDLHGFAANADEIRAAWKRRDQAGMIAAVTDDMVDTMACAGTPAEVADRFADNFDGLYDHTLFYSPSFAMDQGRFVESVQAIIDVFGRTPAASPES